MSTHNILIVLAFLCEFLAAIGVPSGNINLVALGLAFFFVGILAG